MRCTLRPPSVTREAGEVRGICAVCQSSVRFWAQPVGDWIYDRCDTCRHIELRRQPEREELQRYYDRHYRYSEDRFQASVAGYLKAIERAVSLSGIRVRRVLEVGCNTGALLVALRDRRWAVSGIEIAEPFRAVAVGRGLDVRPGLVDWGGESFDVIVSFHVLEHVPDAVAELKALHARLEPGGILILKTPNSASLPARLLKGTWEWTSPPAHLRLYSPESLERAAVTAGFELVAIRTLRGNARPLPFLLLRALGMKLRGPAARFTPGLDPRHVPVSHQPWYRFAEHAGSLVSWFGLPLRRLLSRLKLSPELEVVLRKP